MWRMILVTLVFLGYAFYQISGGSDFEPKLIDVERTSAKEPASIIDTSPSGESNGLVLQNDSQLIEPSQSGRKTVRPPSASTAVPAAEDAEGKAIIDLSKAGEAIFGGAQSGASSDSNVLTISAVSDDVSGDTAPQDLRKVTGLRAALYDGPGINFPMLRPLAMGQQVQVLDRVNGGWVRLRTLGDGQVGWASGSLLSDPLD